MSNLPKIAHNFKCFIDELDEALKEYDRAMSKCNTPGPESLVEYELAWRKFHKSISTEKLKEFHWFATQLLGEWQQLTEGKTPLGWHRWLELCESHPEPCFRGKP